MKVLEDPPGNNLFKDVVRIPSDSKVQYQRTKVFTFINQKKKPISRKNEKLREALLCRDLFGRMLALSLERKINIGDVSSYPLTPPPGTFCHDDGTIFIKQINRNCWKI